jgi:hypothetical protein
MSVLSTSEHCAILNRNYHKDCPYLNLIALYYSLNRRHVPSKAWADRDLNKEGSRRMEVTARVLLVTCDGPANMHLLLDELLTMNILGSACLGAIDEKARLNVRLRNDFEESYKESMKEAMRATFDNKTFTVVGHRKADKLDVLYVHSITEVCIVANRCRSTVAYDGLACECSPYQKQIR